MLSHELCVRILIFSHHYSRKRCKNTNKINHQNAELSAKLSFQITMCSKFYFQPPFVFQTRYLESSSVVKNCKKKEHENIRVFSEKHIICTFTRQVDTLKMHWDKAVNKISSKSMKKPEKKTTTIKERHKERRCKNSDKKWINKYKKNTHTQTHSERKKDREREKGMRNIQFYGLCRMLEVTQNTHTRAIWLTLSPTIFV